MLLITAGVALVAGSYYFFSGAVHIQADNRGDDPIGFVIVFVCAIVIVAMFGGIMLRLSLADLTTPQHAIYALTNKRGIISDTQDPLAISPIPPRLLRTARHSGNDEIGTLTFRYFAVELLLDLTAPDLLKPVQFQNIAFPHRVEALIHKTFSKD